MYSVGFILALLAFGGVAAYLGDVLGYRLGKRKFSLLRLRPRTTARLVSVVAGVMIPAVTVAVGALLIGDVRDALFRLDDLRRDIRTLRADRDAMSAERDRLRHDADRERQAAQLATADAEQSRSDLQEVRNGLDAAKRSLSAAREDVGRLRDETGRLRSDRDRKLADLKHAQDNLVTATQHLGEAAAKLEEVTQSLEKVTDEKATIQAERDELEARTESLRASVAELRRQLRGVQEAWRYQHTLFAESQPILDIGTELVRGVIRRPESVDALTDELVALLVLADASAEAGGAGRGENGRYVRAVWPVPPLRTLEGDEDAPEETVLGFVRRLLWEADAPEQVVRVLVERRAFLGEQVAVRFTATPNELVFRKGENLVTRRLPANLDQAEAFDRLWLLIADPDRSEVRRQAQAAGMLPNPKSGRYGEIGIRELYAAAAECSGRPESVQVEVEAADDTHTVGPLDIHIAVVPSGG